MTGTTQIIRRGRLLDIDARSSEPADILITGNMISEIGPPGLPAPDDAIEFDASDRLLIPGLINGQTTAIRPLPRVWATGGHSNSC